MKDFGQLAALCIHQFEVSFSDIKVTFSDCFIGRRMRDKLIQVERLHLAVEVSTKCGLDPAGVWAAWGMNCLINGDFPQAREKFNRCLKVSCVVFYCVAVITACKPTFISMQENFMRFRTSYFLLEINCFMSFSHCLTAIK